MYVGWLIENGRIKQKYSYEHDNTSEIFRNISELMETSQIKRYSITYNISSNQKEDITILVPSFSENTELATIMQGKVKIQKVFFILYEKSNYSNLTDEDLELLIQEKVLSTYQEIPRPLPESTKSKPKEKRCLVYRDGFNIEYVDDINDIAQLLEELIPNTTKDSSNIEMTLLYRQRDYDVILIYSILEPVTSKYLSDGHIKLALPDKFIIFAGKTVEGYKDIQIGTIDLITISRMYDLFKDNTSKG